MTENDAYTLRVNGSKLYNAVKVAFYASATYIAQQEDISEADVKTFVEEVWHASKLDDLFHRLGSQGYRQLIEDGWNPYVDNDPNDWKPSPDCIDNPTTRGGISGCDTTPDELHKATGGRLEALK